MSAGKQQPLCSRFSLPLSHWINKTWLFLPTDIHTRPSTLMFLETFVLFPPVLRQCINILLYSIGSSAVSFSRGRLVQLRCFITWALLAGNTGLNHPGGNGLPATVSNFSFPRFNLAGYHKLDTGTTISLISRQSRPSHFLSNVHPHGSTHAAIQERYTYYRLFPTYRNRSSNWLLYVFTRSKPIIHFLTSLHHAVFLETRSRLEHLIGKSYRNRTRLNLNRDRLTHSYPSRSPSE